MKKNCKKKAEITLVPAKILILSDALHTLRAKLECSVSICGFELSDALVAKTQHVSCKCIYRFTQGFAAPRYVFICQTTGKSAIK